MGEHQNEAGINVINLLVSFGEILGYYVKREEFMFPGSRTSPIFDITWRRNEHEKSPLFIFEIESTPTKAASDNAIKLFSRKTETFLKPLFFFHIFVEKQMDTDRIKYLKEQYDSVNYDTYLLSDVTSHFRLVSDILEQYFRFDQYLDLYALIEFFDTQATISVTSPEVLSHLIELGYDKLKHSNFLVTLETLILILQSQSIIEFYFSYLPNHLMSTNVPHQDYGYYYTPNGYFRVIQHAIYILLDKGSDKDRYFENLRRIEDGYDPWPLWDPNFGLSHDHDIMMLSEFPLLLTLLCLAFSGTPHAKYFSGRLKSILSEIKNYTHWNIHGLIWLLIASQIADDPDSYEFSRSLINANGGISVNLIVNPTLVVSDEPDQRLALLEDPILIPDYQDWQANLERHIECLDVNILTTIIGSFLIMNQWLNHRILFANYCLQRSLE